MAKFINIAELVIAVLLTVSILLQSRGAGLASTFGGDMGGYYSKRGFEKFLVRFSILLAVLFIALAVAQLFVSSN